MKQILSTKHSRTSDGARKTTQVGVSRGGRTVTTVTTSKRLNKNGDVQIVKTSTYRKSTGKAKENLSKLNAPGKKKSKKKGR